MKYIIKLIFDVDNHDENTEAVLPPVAEQFLRTSLKKIEQEGVYRASFFVYQGIAPIVTLIASNQHTAYALFYQVEINGLTDETIRAMTLQAIPVVDQRADYELFALIDRSIEAV